MMMLNVKVNLPCQKQKLKMYLYVKKNKENHVDKEKNNPPQELRWSRKKKSKTNKSKRYIYMLHNKNNCQELDFSEVQSHFAFLDKTNRHRHWSSREIRYRFPFRPRGPIYKFIVLRSCSCCCRRIFNIELPGAWFLPFAFILLGHKTTWSLHFWSHALITAARTYKS